MERSQLYEFFEGMTIWAVTLLFFMLMCWPAVVVWNNLMPMLFGLPQLDYWGLFGLWFLRTVLLPSPIQRHKFHI